MPDTDQRTHEIAFCSRVAGWLDALFAAHPEWPFRRAEIEQSLALRRKRSDLRVYGDARRLILAGEVKLPGTPDGRTPYSRCGFRVLEKIKWLGVDPTKLLHD